ncbi:hypothetical protein Q8A67_019958 [Cirrhinus molitorella]|uniref:Uncharacterized protein n=1 Tax=Cirrhinus molitorella TaxID=172907 RepID=A0AA88PEV0_9TELE|nr:hypothetical protein Q8A67_019958 [Cirrhinus molitorella]
MSSVGFHVQQTPWLPLASDVTVVTDSCSLPDNNRTVCAVTHAEERSNCRRLELRTSVAKSTRLCDWQKERLPEQVSGFSHVRRVVSRQSSRSAPGLAVTYQTRTNTSGALALFALAKLWLKLFSALWIGWDEAKLTLHPPHLHPSTSKPLIITYLMDGNHMFELSLRSLYTFV